jgi:hypothetical protein
LEMWGTRATKEGVEELQHALPQRCAVWTSKK